MDLGFAISEIKRKFEREYKIERAKMLGDMAQNGTVLDGQRWVRENKLFHDIMEQHLEQLFDSVEKHIGYLTNKSARMTVDRSKAGIQKCVHDQYDLFMKTTLGDRVEIDHLQINGEMYKQINKRMEDDVRCPLNELLQNRFEKLDQIIKGRPNPLWDRPWASHAVSAIMGMIVGAAPTWIPKLISFFRIIVQKPSA